VKASDLWYELPPELVAQHPPAHRRDARLLHLPAAGAPIHRSIPDLPSLVRAGDVFVLNETRVVPARLHVTRETGGAVELFFLGEVPADAAAGGVRAWRVLAKPAKRLREGEVLHGAGGALRLRVLARDGDAVRVEAPAGDAARALDSWGEVPLPPYVRRAPTPEDRERYQTIYARVPGAVAAPTAGLHLDLPLLDEMRARGAHVARLVLHVGPGTFRPLPDHDDLSQVRLDPERFEVPPETAAAIERTRGAGGRVIACGTTAVRALETWARGASTGETALFIHPGFEFRVVDAMLTNFHLPASSLLCLVAAFAGTERVLDAYRVAVRERYRFYSYGDATFLERPS
jgi:S-adenosylmethionine:tRNA ribosyltransferase-isomerase